MTDFQCIAGNDIIRRRLTQEMSSSALLANIVKHFRFVKHLKIVQT